MSCGNSESENRGEDQSSNKCPSSAPSSLKVPDLAIPKEPFAYLQLLDSAAHAILLGGGGGRGVLWKGKGDFTKEQLMLRER